MNNWKIECPQCQRTYIVPFGAPWSCPNSNGKHTPIVRLTWSNVTEDH